MNEIGDIISRMGEVSTAISAAVEEQSATTREIAASIQEVASSTSQAAQAMEHVVEVANQAGSASRNILNEASEIGSESEKLRSEVETFLRAVQADTGERRKFERITGSGVTVMLRIGGKPGVKAAIQDISRTGISACHQSSATEGSNVEVELPFSAGTVTGRLIRATEGGVAVAFSDNPAMLASIDSVLASLSATHRAA